MKIFLRVLFALILLGMSTTIVYGQAPPATGYTTPYEIYSPGSGNTYYLDAINGNDITGDGSTGNPWQTLAKVQSAVTSGDNVVLRSGNYDDFIENSTSRTNWVTYRAEADATPIFTSINLMYPALQDSYLRFDGITIDGFTYNGVFVRHARHIEIRNNKTIGYNKFLAWTGIRLENCENVLVYHNEVIHSSDGILFIGSNALTVSNNYVHQLGAGSGIRAGDGNEDAVIERNHIHDSNEDPNHPDNPADPHSSAISVRSGDLVIRQNIMHDIGSSSGIMFYERDAAGGEDVYQNILLENNVMYDIENRNVLRLDYLGNNIVVRNNTLIGRYRDISTGTYRLCTALTTHLAAGYDGSGLSVYNNIFAGAVWLPNTAHTANNIFWSLAEMGGFAFRSTPFDPSDSGSKILTWSADFPEDYWLNNFFIQTPTFVPDHRRTLDFRPHYLSEAINFGDTTHQPNDSLGMLDGNGFIQNNGRARDAEHHTAGAYEYSPSLKLTGSPQNQTINLNWTVNATVPVTTTWQMDYYTQTTFIDTETDPTYTTRSYQLYPLTNYQWYTVTLYALLDGSGWISDTIRVMPTDHLVFLPVVLK